MSVQIRPFHSDDIGPALNLCRASGWNQLERDWARLLAYEPAGCFVAEIESQLVGTVTSTRYGTELGWIGMMLVDPQYRRRGIATALMRSSVDYLQRAGAACIKLDATPEGRLVYERLGFRSEWSYHRWQRESDSANRFPENTAGDVDDAISKIASLDRLAFGADRTDWLRQLMQDSYWVQDGDSLGMGRRGHLADYLGPVMAADETTAERIIGQLLQNAGGNVFWDIPGPHESAIRLARRFGFEPVRDLTRMWLGTPHRPQVNLQFAISDPGTG